MAIVIMCLNISAQNIIQYPDNFTYFWSILLLSGDMDNSEYYKTAGEQTYKGSALFVDGLWATTSHRVDTSIKV